MRATYKAVIVDSSDDGLSLIEVLVAMMIFAMLVVGIGYSLINILQMTKDNQARETAISLASSELDAVRAIGNPFEVFDVPSRVQTVGTNTYTISRTSGWKTPGGDVETCGTGDGPLEYKVVNVSVSWVAMGTGSNTVRTDTALVPTSRINDPSKGTILVSVKNEAGLGNAGVAFTATSGGVELDTTVTNVDGCSFLLKVEPGEYTIKLVNAKHMDITQSDTPFLKLPVVAGGSAQFHFQYDERGTFPIKYASNVVGPAPFIPSDLTTTFFNSNGRYTTKVLPAGNVLGSTYLYPARSGYEVVAGSLVPRSETGTSCESVDPAAWAETATAPPLKGMRPPAAVAAPGQSASLTPVPMGIITVAGDKNRPYLYAVSQNVAPLPGQPVCDIETTYLFNFKMFTGSGTTMKTIALPFGSWKLYASNSDSNKGTYEVPRSAITLVTPGLQPTPGNTFVLDPRGVTP